MGLECACSVALFSTALYVHMLHWTLFLQRWDWGWAGGIAEAAEILLWAAAHLRLPIL